MDLKFRIDEGTGNIHVDGTATCGAEFIDVAVVLEPDSENPGLLLERPLGFAAVQSILDYVGDKEERCRQLN